MSMVLTICHISLSVDVAPGVDTGGGEVARWMTILDGMCCVV